MPARTRVQRVAKNARHSGVYKARKYVMYMALKMSTTYVCSPGRRGGARHSEENARSRVQQVARQQRRHGDSGGGAVVAAQRVMRGTAAGLSLSLSLSLLDVNVGRDRMRL